MKMLDKTEQSDRISNPNEKPESCYCSALPKESGPCLPCYTRWLAGQALVSKARPTAVVSSGQRLPCATGPTYRAMSAAICSGHHEDRTPITVTPRRERLRWRQTLDHPGELSLVRDVPAHQRPLRS